MFGRLQDTGYAVGVRILELISFREKNFKREQKIEGMLSFISYTIWKVLFGKHADSLEKNNDSNDQCNVHINSKDSDIIIENQPLNITKFISIPKDYSNMTSSSYVAGIIEGVLDASDFVRFFLNF